MVGPDHVMGLAIGNELERRVVLIVTTRAHTYPVASLQSLMPRFFLRGAPPCNPSFATLNFQFISVKIRSLAFRIRRTRCAQMAACPS